MMTKILKKKTVYEFWKKNIVGLKYQLGGRPLPTLATQSTIYSTHVEDDYRIFPQKKTLSAGNILSLTDFLLKRLILELVKSVLPLRGHKFILRYIKQKRQKTKSQKDNYNYEILNSFIVHPFIKSSIG